MVLLKHGWASSVLLMVFMMHGVTGRCGLLGRTLTRSVNALEYEVGVQLPFQQVGQAIDDMKIAHSCQVGLDSGVCSGLC